MAQTDRQELTEALSEPMQRHFAWMRARWPAATITPHASGAYVVVVPGVQVEGYDAPTTTVTFIAPVGFPLACPSDFTTTPPLSLAHGGQPAYTRLYEDESALHWYHRLTRWDPQRDSLLNYMGTILRRLRPPLPVEGARDGE